MLDEQFWKNVPKTYCDNANMAVIGGVGDMFMLALLSGGNAQAFAFTPEHMKKLSQLIEYNLKSYEQAKGPIKVDPWTPEVKSPFQIKDLNGGKGGSGESDK